MVKYRVKENRIRGVFCSFVERTLVPIEDYDEKPICDCIYWGENRLDELFLDVGCVLGKSVCDPEKCDDYKKIDE